MNPEKIFFSKDKFIGQKKSFRIVVDGSKITLYSGFCHIYYAAFLSKALIPKIAPIAIWNKPPPCRVTACHISTC